MSTAYYISNNSPNKYNDQDADIHGNIGGFVGRFTGFNIGVTSFYIDPSYISQL